MLTATGPKVIEFNARFGDPEAQVVLPMLDEDLSWLLASAVTGALPRRRARFRAEPHVGVVLAAAGYPDTPRAGDVITGIDAPWTLRLSSGPPLPVVSNHPNCDG